MAQTQHPTGNHQQSSTSHHQPATNSQQSATHSQRAIPSRSKFRFLIAVPLAVVLVLLMIVVYNRLIDNGANLAARIPTSPQPEVPTFVISGTVTDAYSNNPVTNAGVTAGQVQVTTDLQGRYRIGDWQPSDTEADTTGRDMLVVSTPGYEDVTIPLTLDTTQSAPLDAPITVDVALRPNGLHGVVTNVHTGQPVSGAQVIATLEMPAAGNALTATAALTSTAATRPLSSTGVLSVTTDATGTYTMTGVTRQLTVTITAPGYATLEETLQRTTTYDAELHPNVLTGTIIDLYSSEPLDGVSIEAGSSSTTTNAQGEYRVEDIAADTTQVLFRADGYEAVTRTITRTMQMDAVLRPNTITADLFDQSNGTPISNATIIATETLTSSAVAFTRIDNSTNGRFTLKNVPEHGYIQVLSPGYRKAVLELMPGSIPSEIALEPFFARAIYVKTSVAEDMSNILAFFDSIDQTELNAIVIDLKSDDMADLGLIYYESQVPIIRELGTSKDLMDIRAILAEAKRRNIYTIARIHIFAHDNLLAETKPEWAAQDPNGCIPNENRRCNGDIFYADWDIAWLDPWNRNVWDYNIQLGKEAAQLGFDEIQFDYIRFPNDAANLEDMQLSQPIDYNNPQPMYENIAALLEQAHHTFNSVGAFFSVDIFGYAVWFPQPIIGQNAAMMAEHADYIYPMVYPSHFMTNEMGFANAAAHPYEIVHGSLVRGKELIAGKRALMRPWLQDFTLLWVPAHLIVHYGPAEVRAQIDAVEDFPHSAGWALWDSDNHYTYEALEPE